MRINHSTLIKIALVFALLIMVGLGLFGWTGADKHMTTLVEGDYIVAEKQFREAAEQGDATAQYNLALMYDSGKDIPQDDAKAIKWYLEAATQGYAPAQYNLSMVHFFGKGTPQDYVAAYKWIILADANEEEHAKDAMLTFAEKLSPEQIAEAKEAAQAWQEEHGKQQ